MKEKKSSSPLLEKSDCIECQEALIQAKRINTNLPKKDPVLKKLVYIYKLQRGASATIAKELNPKIALLDSDSMLNEGDVIRGRVINCKTTRPFPRETVQHASGRHKGQFITAREYVFCKVFIPIHQGG